MLSVLLTALATVSLPGNAVSLTVGATAEGKEATVAVAGGFFANCRCCGRCAAFADVGVRVTAAEAI